MNGANIILIYLRQVISGLFRQCRLNGGNLSLHIFIKNLHILKWKIAIAWPLLQNCQKLLPSLLLLPYSFFNFHVECMQLYPLRNPLPSTHIQHLSLHILQWFSTWIYIHGWPIFLYNIFFEKFSIIFILSFRLIPNHPYVL